MKSRIRQKKRNCRSKRIHRGGIIANHMIKARQQDMESSWSWYSRKKDTLEEEEEEEEERLRRLRKVRRKQEEEFINLLKNGSSIKEIYEGEGGKYKLPLNQLFDLCIKNDLRSKLKEYYTLKEYVKFSINYKLLFDYLPKIYSKDEFKEAYTLKEYLHFSIKDKAHIFSDLIEIYSKDEFKEAYTLDEYVQFIKQDNAIVHLPKIYSNDELKNGLSLQTFVDLILKGRMTYIDLLNIYTKAELKNGLTLRTFLDLISEQRMNYRDLLDIYTIDELVEQKKQYTDIDKFIFLSYMKIYGEEGYKNVKRMFSLAEFKDILKKHGYSDEACLSACYEQFTLNFIELFKDGGFTYGEIKQLYNTEQASRFDEKRKNDFDEFRKFAAKCKKEIFGKTDINCTFDSIKWDSGWKGENL
jgi:hypothetical protein